ncbi:retrovirus-related pol polyprotein from transposon TNT 1-94 [Tanacetum coccineum]
MIELPLVDSGFDVPVFSPRDDPIACFNKATAFLIAIASLRFPSTNNQLRTSLNLRNQATIQDGRVTVQQVQGRQGQSYSSTSYKSNDTSFGGNNASGQAKVVKCYNCQAEGHMTRQCTQPKRPWNAAWYKEKAMLAEAQEARQILDEEQLAFLADLGTEDLDTYDSDCDDISNEKAVLMANISNYGSDVILEVSTKIVLLGLKGCLEQDELPSSIELDFRARLGGGRDPLIAQDSSAVEVTKLTTGRLVNGSSCDGIDMVIENLDFEPKLYAMMRDFLDFAVLSGERLKQESVKAQQIKPTLYDGIVISVKHVAMPVIEKKETLILKEESRSKMSKKEKDPEAIKQNISHKPIDYEKLNILTDDFWKCFTPRQELLAEQAFWLRMSNPTSKPSDASPVKIEAPKELPKVSLVNESLKKLKFHLARFYNVVKIRTTSDARTEGEWGFEHIKAIFNNEIIPFLKSLKDIFNVFNKDLLNEIMEVQTVFDQINVAVQQSSIDKQCLEIAKKELVLENDRLLQQIMSQDVLLN